ncbi:MAG TPA: DUF4332 domain-containing protein [Aestuariivirgaceae bacterium]|nr:DUF4332 domain-containing protein [Aestuariivirgaceae bacterium]
MLDDSQIGRRPVGVSVPVAREVSYSLRDISGIGPAMAGKLRTARIRTTRKLLEAASSAKGRKALAASTGLNERDILKAANKVDLMRIKGIGEDFTELLCAAGVDTVRDLKHRNPANLAKAMRSVNKKRPKVQLVPSEATVARWIERAKTLEILISY